MLTLYHLDQGTLLQSVAEGPLHSWPEKTVWIDLFKPTKEDERAVEQLLGVEVPTREEMQEIEASSRVYVEDKALVMTLPVLNKSASDEPELAVVTFLLADDRLVTLRYADPAPFNLFIQRINRQPSLASSGDLVLLGLLEQIADRLADILETAIADLEGLSREIFAANHQASGSTNFKDVLRRIGYAADLTTKAKDSLLNLNRMLPFFAAKTEDKKELKVRIKTLLRDAASIDEQATFLSAKISFLLDATLGMINIEQNNIIKIFSVAAVAFLPPTLIASVYGMNFEVLPELKWGFGYPLALMLMFLSAALPFCYFKRKKWL
ncbi:MAG: magnesium transporter CorA family protein [Alphaproteobacteria bacterium]|nr:magnesium transporter CorA family protein [Alphaproteobacteria bacterium]